MYAGSCECCLAFSAFLHRHDTHKWFESNFANYVLKLNNFLLTIKINYNHLR